MLDKLVPLVLSVAQAYFFKQWGKEEVKNDTSAYPSEGNSTAHTLKKVV